MTEKKAPEGFTTFELEAPGLGKQTRYRCKTCRTGWDTYSAEEAEAHLDSELHRLGSGKAEA